MTKPPYTFVRRLRGLTRSEVGRLPLEDLQTLRDELLDWATRVDEHIDEAIDNATDFGELTGMFPGISWKEVAEDE